MGIKAPAQGGEAGDDIATVCFYDRGNLSKFQANGKISKIIILPYCPMLIAGPDQYNSRNEHLR